MNDRERLLETILDSITAHVAVLDKSGRIIFVNSAWKTFARENGSKNEDAYLGFDYLAVCEAALERENDESAAALQGIREVLNGARTEFSMVYPCHSPVMKRWFIMRASAMNEYNGGIVIVHNDITERKLAEEELRASEEKYRNLFENLAEQVQLWKLVRDQAGNIQTWRLVDINPAGMKAWGKTQAETVGKTADEIFPGATAFFMPIVQKIFREEVPYSRESYFPMSNQYLHMIDVPLGEYFITTGMDITERKRAEMDLLKSQNLLKETGHIGKVGGWEFNIDTFEQTWTDEVYRIHELGPDFRPTVENGIAFYAPEAQVTIEEAVRRSIELGEPFNVELPFITAKGNRRWVRVIGERDPDNRRVFGFFQDITERKLAEEALERTSSTLAEAQKIAHLGSFEYITANRSTIWSEEQYRIFGLDPIDPSPEYDVMLKEFIHPDDAASMHEEFTNAMQNCAAYEHEHRIVRPDGSVRWVLSSAHPYFDGQGKLARYIGITLDITERKEAELALIKERAFLERVMETVPAGVLILDANGKISYANSQAERILGFSQDEIKKQPYNDPAWKKTDLEGNYFPVEELPFSRVVSARIPVYNVEHAIERPDGKRVFLSVNAALLLDNKGNLEGVVETINDITALKQAEKRIHAFSRKLLNVREQERMQISTALHHDLGFVTINVTSRLQAAKDYLQASRFRKALQVLEEGERMFTEAIRQLKKLAIELRPPDLDLLGLQSALRQYFAQVSKGIPMKISFSDASRGITIPPDFQTVIFRIAQECLNNTIQHAGALHARVRLSASKGMLKLSFTDDGRGFNPESFIINPGDHMGLLTMQEMARDSGGDIKIESKPGKGTKVSVTVPLNMEGETSEVAK